MYSKGRKPNEYDVFNDFTRYFNYTKPGKPVPVEYNDLNLSDVTNVDILNQLMANSALNLEVLYDAVWENNDELFNVVNTLNNRVNNLKAKRRELEAYVDQLLFSNENTDGYFYSFLEPFATTNNIDLGLTTSYVDIENGTNTISKINSDITSALEVNKLTSSSIRFSASFNSESVKDYSNIENSDLMFDGLNDTYWAYDIDSDSIGVAAVTIDIPLSSGYQISNISGSILTTSPSSVVIRLTNYNSDIPDYNDILSSRENYDKFNFNVPSDTYSNLLITIFKTDPDEVRHGLAKPYRYSFGLRELNIISRYYDTKGITVSKPISLPVADDSTMSISSVALEAKASVPTGTSVKYYVAPDVEFASSVSDFDWKRIYPTDTVGNLNNVLNITGSNYKIEYFDSLSSKFVPVPASDSGNANTRNPAILPYSNKEVYRYREVPRQMEIFNPSIYSGINSATHYGKINSTITNISLYKNLDYWYNEILEKSNNESYLGVSKVELNDQSISMLTPFASRSSGVFVCKLLCTSQFNPIHTVTKDNPDVNLAIYLNGSLIADLPEGVSSTSCEWSFLEGVNSILISYDKELDTQVRFSLMAGVSLSEYGTVYNETFTYLSPIDFRTKVFDTGKYFTIEDFYGSRQIMSSHRVNDSALMMYYSNEEDVVQSLRYRIDMERFSNPLQSPAIDSVRLKFKHGASS